MGRKKIVWYPNFLIPPPPWKSNGASLARLSHGIVNKWDKTSLGKHLSSSVGGLGFQFSIQFNTAKLLTNHSVVGGVMGKSLTV